MKEDYNADIMANDIAEQITAFAAKHPDEIFYAFCIEDHGCFSLNTETAFTDTLAEYRENWEQKHAYIPDLSTCPENELARKRRWVERFQSNQNYSDADLLEQINQRRTKDREEGNPYYQQDEIEELRYNSGDWLYQEVGGFTWSPEPTPKTVEEHNAMSGEEIEEDEAIYDAAADDIMAHLIANNAFKCLRTTADFRAFRSKHVY